MACAAGWEEEEGERERREGKGKVEGKGRRGAEGPQYSSSSQMRTGTLALDGPSGKEAGAGVTAAVPSLSCPREAGALFYLPPHSLFLQKLRCLLRGSPLALSQA